MKFGYFDDNRREYVITRPDTPYPWINYLGEEDFFSLTSNTGGGYSFYKDARMLRLVWVILRSKEKETVFLQCGHRLFRWVIRRK